MEVDRRRRGLYESVTGLDFGSGDLDREYLLPLSGIVFRGGDRDIELEIDLEYRPFFSDGPDF